MLETLKISSFRGIAKLELRDLARINVLIGTNGAGKTSILEAAALVANPNNPGLLNSLAAWREMPALNDQSDFALRTIFANLDENKPVEFAFRVDGGDHRLRISASSRRSSVVETGPTTQDYGQPVESSAFGESLSGVEYDYISPSQKYPLSLRLSSKGFEIQGELSRRPGESQPLSPKTLGSFYIHARRATSAAETSNILTSLYETKQEANFIQALRAVEPRIKTLVTGIKRNQPVVLADIGLARLIPVNALGDGFCRVLLMLTGLSAGKQRLLIVDEIDSGLHPAVMKDFWRSLLTISEARNVQVFCTTHNEEMLVTTIGAFENQPDALRIFRMDRHSNLDVSVQSYNYDEFSSATFSGLDVR